MDLQLEYPQSQRYDILTDYASPSDEEVRDQRETNCNFTHRKRSKITYPSPVWCRDSTNRLQRKPIRKSTSCESSLNEIDLLDSLMTECSLQRKPMEKSTSFETSLNESSASNSLINSTHMNDSSPRWQRVEYECTTQLRKDLMPTQNRKIFNSTMKNGYSHKTLNETNANPEKMLSMIHDTTPAINRRNHSGKLTISNIWTPFWSRNESSKRLDRRHYISDFFDCSVDLHDY